MQHKHWNQEELLAILYGVKDVDAEECGACAACTAKLEALRERQASDAALAVNAIADRQLAAQRASIYARLDSRPANRWMWMAAPLAAAAALLVAVNLPTTQPVEVAQNVPAVVETADDTLYSDIYQTVTQETPGGVSVVSAMFETAKN